MPLYMDRHDVSDQVTAENVAELHQQDLKIQHQFNCNGLTYWFDEKRKTAFCLIEAPNEEAIKEMHRHAHGEVPHRIIEVDHNIVESFLGRIEDPEKALNTQLNIINDAAFRVIMLISVKALRLNEQVRSNFNTFVNQKVTPVIRKIEEFNGRVVRQKSGKFLISFRTVSNAIDSAMALVKLLAPTGNIKELVSVNISICAGVPVTDENTFFEKSIATVSSLCEVDQAPIVITKEVEDLYTSENHNIPITSKHIFVIPAAKESFLNQLMDFVNEHWSEDNIKVEDFNKYLGMSKAQLYRRMVDLLGKSPSAFLRDFRLNKALGLLEKKVHTVSEVTFMTGYNSPSYFSKSFHQMYGILPSEVAKPAK